MKKNLPIAIGVLTVAIAFIAMRNTENKTGQKTEAPEVAPVIVLADLAQPLPAAEKPEPAIVPDYTARSFASVFPGIDTPRSWRAFKPERLTVAPIDGAPISFTRTGYAEANGRTSWSGRNEDAPLASFVFSANEKAWAGVMLLPDGSEYAMHSLADGSVAVRRTATSPLPCPVDESHAADVSTVAAKAAHSVMHDTGAAVAAADAGLERTYAFDAAELPTEPELDLPDANGIYYSALLIAVDKHFVNALGLPVSATQEQKQAQVDVTCAAYTMAMNIILQNSQVDNLRWALVGTVIAPDDFSNQSISSSLDEMAYFGAKYQDGSPVNPSEKMGGPARREASKLGADQILFIAGAYITGDHAGIAVQSADDDNRFSPYATAYDVFGVKTFAHELGHTFGLRHDRVTDNVPDNNGKYYYGYEWYLPDLNNNSALASNGDVMSYAANPVAYFSNPQIELNNADVAMGHYQFPAGTSRIGVPASEAKAADASRWLREKARQMASFRKSLVFLYNPPGSTAVAPGSMLTLSALATVGRTDLGNDDKISYQWFFNNFPITSIASGTTRALTIPSVSAANAGTYHVRATSMGEVTVLSTSAVVSVTSGLPVIASHPQSVSVAKGGILTLSASVSGSNLAFQWKRNGVAITGANSPTYTKTGVTDADEGTYTLTVSNDSGSVTSQPATVTVTGGSDGGNDNGGGGGAPGTLYLVLLASLIVIKFIRGK